MNYPPPVTRPMVRTPITPTIPTPQIPQIRKDEPTPTPAQTQGVKKHYNSYSEIHLSVISHFGLRFFQIFLLFAFGLTILFQSSFSIGLSGVFGWLSFASVSFIALLLLTGFTLFMLRNLTFTVWEPTYPSLLSELLACWTSLDNLIVLGINTSLSWILVRFYFSYIAKESYTSSILVTPLGHYLGARQLNQENIFIGYYIILLSLFYTYQYISKRVYVIKIDAVQQPILQEVKTGLASLICRSCMTAIYTLLYAYVSYMIFNSTIYHTIARFFGLFYSLLDSPVIGFNWTDIRLLARTLLAGSLTTITFNFIHSLYNTLFSRITPTTDICSNQFDILIDGINNQRERSKVFAFAELAALACKRVDKRKELYQAVGKEVKDTAWFKIMQACFGQLDELKNKIDVEFNGAPKATPSIETKPTPTTATSASSNDRRLQFEEGQDIYARPVKKATVLDDRTSQIFCDVTERYEEPVSIMTDEYSNSLTQYLQNLYQNGLVDFIKTIELKAGYAGALHGLYAETTTRRTHKIFRKHQLTIWAIQILASLTSCSLTEDRYGYVQNNINDVLNALLDLLILVEKYETSPPIGHARLLNDKVKAHESHAVALALREGLYQIRTTFGDYLNYFEVDRKYSQKWQRFIDFQE